MKYPCSCSLTSLFHSRFSCLLPVILLLTSLLFMPAPLACAEVIVADDFFYSQPMKEFGPGGGFTLADYGGGQNGPAGAWQGRWASSGDGIITDADFATDLDDFPFGAVLGQTFSPTDTFIERNYQLADSVTDEMYFGVRAGVDIDTFGSPRMYIHNPLDEATQIAIGFDEFGGFLAQLGSNFDDNGDQFASDGALHQLVGKLEVNAEGSDERLTVWMNPTGPEEGDSVSVTEDVIESVDQLSGVLRLSRVATGGNSFFDDVAMGTSWDDVTSVEVPRLSLVIDENTGNASLFNGSDQSFDLNYYVLQADSGMLDLDSWMSLAEQGQEGWMENNSTVNKAVESNFLSPTTIGPGASLGLGAIAANADDVVARFGTVDGLLNVAPIESGTVGPVGDFNANGMLDAGDMDVLTAEVNAGTNNLQFDLDGNGAVDADDRAFWIQSIANSYFGDSNLDGEFNSGDFVSVFTAGEYEDGVVGNSTWATGDWNGDTEFDSSDFVTAFAAGGYEAGPRAAVASVPEPTSATLTGIAAVALIAAGQRRRLGFCR